MRSLQGRVWLVLTIVILLTAIAPGADKKPKMKAAVIEIKGLKVTLDGTKINIDGTLHNAGERTIEKLVLSFHFFDTEHKPVTVLRLEIDDETIDSDEDAEIHAAANEP